MTFEPQKSYPNLPLLIKSNLVLYIISHLSEDYKWLENNALQNVKQMNNLGFQVAALGKKELNLREEKLIELLNLAEFTLINSHLNFENPTIRKAVKKFQIITIDTKKIGVLAISKGFVLSRDLNKLNQLSNNLKQDQNCDMIICLVSNSYQKNTLKRILSNSKSIDLFMASDIADLQGGHLILRNMEKQEVMLLYGQKNERSIGHYKTNFQHPFLALPLRLSHQLSLQNI